MTQRIALTLDTDTVRDVWDSDERAASVLGLIDLAAIGAIDLAVTRHIEDDVPWPPLADRIRELPELGIDVTGGVFRLGASALGGRDGLGSDVFDNWWWERQSRRTQGEPALPGSTDYHHLHAHFIQGRDIFVTWDKAILRLGPELHASFGLRVMTPADAMDIVRPKER